MNNDAIVKLEDLSPSLKDKILEVLIDNLGYEIRFSTAMGVYLCEQGRVTAAKKEFDCEY